MTSWIIPSISVMVCSVVILIFIYLYLFFYEKKRFMGIWLISWVIYLFAQIGTLIYSSGINSSLLNAANYIAFLISAILFVWGAYSFLDKKFPKWWLIIVTLNILWVIITTCLNKPIMVTSFPVGIVLGCSTIWVGIVFLYFGKGKKYLYGILGGCFILWGLHKMDYMFTRSHPWLFSWGYIISAAFLLIATITFIFIYFDNMRTELIGTQKVLMESERKLLTIIENQINVIFEIDNEGKFTYVSSACVGALGISQAEIEGNSFKSFVGNDMWENIIKEKQNGTFFEKVLAKKDNTTEYLSIYCRPSFMPSGELKSVFGSAHNITKDKQLDEAIEYDKIKTEFFANISHEFKTPLNVMLASVQLLEMYNKNQNKTEITDKVEKTVYTVKQNIYRLLRLINNLIDVTKVDTGFFELNLSYCNIVNVVEDVTMSVADYAKNKGISIEFDTDTEERVIACDPDKIERVMLNLLSNAVKFTHPGGHIWVKFFDGKDNIGISVKDTGIGIPNDKQDIIFERFRQVDKSLSRNHEGSGIGLTLVKSFVELHSGTIKLESTYGNGSEFIIQIPVNKPEDEIAIDRFDYVGTRNTDIEFSDIYY